MATAETIGIVGAKGKYGRWLTRFCEFNFPEATVCGSDKDDDSDEAARRVAASDVVIFSVS